MSTCLKNLKRLWADSCRTMWVEILALRNLEGFLRARYYETSPQAELTDITYAPECKGRLDSLHKDYYLDNVDEFVNNLTAVRVVLLSASFESYFYEFMDEYLQHRPKYFNAATGTRTDAGDHVYGQVRSQRGPILKLETFSTLTGAKTKSIAPKLPVLNEVYTLRNVVAHRAGICDAGALPHLHIVAARENEKVLISPSTLVKELAPPCLEIAETLDRKIIPAS